MTEFEDMVSAVKAWFKHGKIDDQKAFCETSKENLIQYHTTLGRAIRNEFKLWESEWKPDIQNGVDCSADHPEQISMRVIEEVWKRVKER